MRFRGFDGEPSLNEGKPFPAEPLGTLRKRKAEAASSRFSTLKEAIIKKRAQKETTFPAGPLLFSIAQMRQKW